jgi:activator of HSP90 ATPase
MDVELHRSSLRIYEAILDSKQFAACSGMPGEIDRKVGGAFSMFGGMIVGRNIELIPHQRIVQAWRPRIGSRGMYSIVRFEFAPLPPVPRSRWTTLVFRPLTSTACIPDGIVTTGSR